MAMDLRVSQLPAWGLAFREEGEELGIRSEGSRNAFMMPLDNLVILCHPLLLRKIFPKLHGEVAFKEMGLMKRLCSEVVQRESGNLVISGGT